MTYRQSFEACPRCSVELENAGSVRACSQCRGQWLLEAVFAEMLIEMLPPGHTVRPPLVPRARGGETLGCPSCGERMEVVSLLGVELDRCPRQHGVWCDGGELEAALRRTAEEPVVATISAPSDADTVVARSRGTFVFAILSPGDVLREVTVTESIIKIGRLPSAHVHVANDDRVARMHAVIEVENGPTLIDLGTRDGTFVNGARVNKQRLVSGDVLLVGATSITITF